MNRSAFLAGSLIAAMGLAVTSVPAGATVPDQPEFCTPWLTASAIFQSDEVDPAAAEQALADVQAAVPEEIAAPAEVVVAAASQALTGDFSGFDTPEFQTSVSEVDNWVFDQCAFDTKLEVQAVDWAFGAIPLEVPAGTAAFRLNNLGAELHEIQIIRMAEGTTESFEELLPMLAMEDPAAMEKIVFVAGGFSPGPDTPGVAFANLEPGEYAAICFIPIGTMQSAMEEPATEDTASEGTAAEGTASEGTAAEGEAPYEMHAAHGMLQLFTVVEGG